MGASVEITEIARVLRRWRWAIILVPLFCLLVAAVIVFYVITPIYVASTTLLVGRNVFSDQQAPLQYEDLVLSRQLVGTYGEIVRSWTVSEEVIRLLQLSLSVDQLRRKIVVTSVGETQVMRLSVTDSDPVMAQQIANTTATVFAQRVPELLRLNNVSILDSARVPLTPTKPRKAPTIALAGTAGLMFILAFTLAWEYFDTRIRNKTEVEKVLELPVLGTIPKANKASNAHGSSTFLPLVDNPRSPVSEAFRVLRTNIQFYLNRKGARIIAITSPQPMEGKTTVAANLAIAIAQTGKRVTLVDADLRRPSLHRVMGLPNDWGLSNLLAGSSDAPEEQLHHTPIDGLMLLPSGPTPEAPAELLDSQRLTDVFQYLRGVSDLIIIDTPPVALVTDAAIIGSKSDGVLLVTSETKQRSAVTARNALEQVDAVIIGVILNQATVAADLYYESYTSE